MTAMYATKQRFNRLPTEAFPNNGNIPQERRRDNSVHPPYASGNNHAGMRRREEELRYNENPRTVNIDDALKVHAMGTSKVLNNGFNIHYNDTKQTHNGINNRRVPMSNGSFEEVRTEEERFLPRGSGRQQTPIKQRDESSYDDYDDYDTDEYVEEEEDEVPRIDIIEGCGNSQTYRDILYGTPKAYRQYSDTADSPDDETEDEKRYSSNRRPQPFTYDDRFAREQEELWPRRDDPRVHSPLTAAHKSDYLRRSPSGKQVGEYSPLPSKQYMSYQRQQKSAGTEAPRRARRASAEPFNKDRSHSMVSDESSSFETGSSNARAPYGNSKRIGSGERVLSPRHRISESPTRRSLSSDAQDMTQYRFPAKDERKAEERGEYDNQDTWSEDKKKKKKQNVNKELRTPTHQKRNDRDYDVRRAPYDVDRVDRQTKRQKECEMSSENGPKAPHEDTTCAAGKDSSSKLVAFEVHEHNPKWSWDSPAEAPMKFKQVDKQPKKPAKEKKDHVEAMHKEKKKAHKKKEEKRVVRMEKVNTGCCGLFSKAIVTEATQTPERQCATNGVEKRGESKGATVGKSGGKHTTRTRKEERRLWGEETRETNGKRHAHSRSHSRSQSRSQSRSRRRRDGDLTHSNAEREGEEPVSRRTPPRRRG